MSATANDVGGTSPSSAAVRFTVDLSTPEQPPEEKGGSTGTGDSSWLLARLEGAASRRRRLVRQLLRQRGLLYFPPGRRPRNSYQPGGRQDAGHAALVLVARSGYCSHALSSG